MKRSILLLVLYILLGSPAVITARAAWEEPVRLTDPSQQCLNPRINSHGHMVWRQAFGEQTTRIILFDGTTQVAVTSGAFEDLAPDLNDSDQVVFHRRLGPDDWEVMLYDHGTLTNLSDTPGKDINPVINNLGHVVWQQEVCDGSGNCPHRLLRYDGTAVTEIVPASAMLSGEAHAMNDHGQVAFMSYNDIVWIYDGGYVPLDAGRLPDINNAGQVVYETPEGDIMLYDGGPGTGEEHFIRITDSVIVEGYPSINDNDKIAFTRAEVWTFDQNVEVLVYDLASGLTTVIQDHGQAYVAPLWLRPRINDEDQVVWAALTTDLDAGVYTAEKAPPPGPVCTLLPAGGETPTPSTVLGFLLVLAAPLAYARALGRPFRAASRACPSTAR